MIGGGIVGAGVARDAALRGLRTGLVEQHDFAFGTSSRSSRLLHGGIRYLAQGRLGLVRQASVEKRILHRIAPHLAEPLAFVFPTYRGTEWPLWQMRIGVKIYDLLCGGKNLGQSESLTKAEVLQAVPELSAEELTGAVRYFDGFTNDARLVLDTLRSAAKHGAMVLNYCRFEDAANTGGYWECQLELSKIPLTLCEVSDSVGEASRLSGSEQKRAEPLPAGRLRHTVRARTVVNATGAWADGLPHSHLKLRLTKGIHLVLPRQRLPVTDAAVITQDKRVLFIIPWGERLIVGTTDTDYKGSLEDVRAEGKDREYLIRVVNEFFPRVQLSSADIISTWAGVRPLISDGRSYDEGAPSDISRAHQIRNPEPGWWDVAGGKLTTYRLMAEETVNEIVDWLKRSNELNREIPPCRTADEPLLPPAETKGVSGILPPEFSRSVVEHYCANEWAMHLDDVMIRRTSWQQYFMDASQRADQVADWMAGLLGWSEAERESELDRVASNQQPINT